MKAEAAPRTAKRKRARWAIITAVLVVVVVMAIAAPMVLGGGRKSTAAAPTSTVAQGTLIVSASADGQTEADDTYNVYPEVSGTVETVEVEIGDKVEAGDTLFILDDSSLQSAVRQAKAQLSQAKQQVASAEQQVASADQQVASAKLQKLQSQNNLDKLESMTGTMTASASQISEAEHSVSVAKAGVTTAKSAQRAANASLASAQVSRKNAQTSYDDAKNDLEMAIVVAPAAGVVTQVNVIEGGSVSTGGSTSGSSNGSGSSASMEGAGASSSAPVVISDNSVLIATVAVNEVDIADVKKGQEATVTFDAASGLAIPATVRWVSPTSATSGSVRTYDVELELAEQSAQLRPGMTASADIATLKVDGALLVPKTAVRVDGTTKFVTVVNPNGIQEKRTVTTGRSDDLNVQILSGLKAGEKVTTTFTTTAVTSGGGFMPPRPPSGMGAR
jgi:multidrug efflux pump subunit AcrA (membrane-fusion protein)